jgi:serine phosphatase RsbU (regulator of sigma subunit)/anti-sigma regulatory factor (Ser/Thr protein kinase)
LVSAVRVELVLDQASDAVPRARNVVRQALRLQSTALVDDAALVATELLTNGVLHGQAPITLTVSVHEAGLRVEVQDCGAQLPVLPRASSESMTGRGLALVAQLAAQWGVETRPGAGKTVWVELTEAVAAQPGTGDFGVDVDLDALLDAFSDDDDPLATFRLELGSVPTELLLTAKSAVDNVVREFQLEAAAHGSAGADAAAVPAELAALVTGVVHSFADARNAIKRQALAAAARGEREVALVLSLPESAADAGERYLAALEEADRYARNARLLSLETPPVHQVFRRWYVQTVVDQLRAAAAGEPVPVTPTFPEMLGAALTRLAPLEVQATRLAALQQVTSQLTGAGGAREIASIVVRSATQVLRARSAHLYLVDGELLRSAADEGTFNVQNATQYIAFPIDSDTPGGVALLTGEPVVIRGRAELARRFPTVDVDTDRDVSILVAPMIIGGHKLGVLSVLMAGDARVEEHAQRTFLMTLADVAAQALERAEASNAAAQANERLSFLADASMILSSSLEYRPVLEAVANLVVPRLADWCSIQLREGDRLLPVAIAHVDPDKVRWARDVNERYPTDINAAGGSGQVLRTGVSLLVSDIPDELLQTAAVDTDHLSAIRQIGMRSGLTVPLTGRNGPIGVITMIMAESGRRYTPEDCSFAEDLARRAAVAVENAHQYREQTGRLASVLRVAEAAQQAILSPPPARIGCVQLAASYVSAAAEALVGGDLYEVVARPGSVRLLIGDVKGKGLEAVRTATIVLGEFRSAAADVDDLVAVAMQIDRRLRDYLAAEDFITALIVEVRYDGTYAIACCGHPPPLRARAGDVQRLPVKPTVPLGLGAAPELTTGQLQAGDRLLLYTDGILEARDPKRGFVDLMALVKPLSQGELGTALDGVLGALRDAVGGELGDDLALLIAEFSPTR